jgi:serine phosphatase RsbU (regulator of sigma subunit)
LDGIAIGALSIALGVSAILLARSMIRMRRTTTRFDVLNQIAHISDRGGSLRETLDATCSIIVPELADICMIDLIKGERVERIAVRVGPGGSEKTVKRLAERRPSLPRPIMEGDLEADPVAPRYFERMTDEDLVALSHDEEDLEFIRDLEIRSAITVALKARGKLTGALTICTAWSGRRYRSEDVDFAGVLSGRVALTLENAGLFSDLEAAEGARAEIADTLQRGLLPPPLPHISGWAVAASYRPAGAENEVGGDFYDAFPAAGGWMLVVGDVTGRGARAASVTAQARYTLRTAAALTGDPLVALATLNRALLARGDAALCSVAALAVAEDPSKPLRLAVAGHPPPLLVSGESVTELAGAGPVLGAFRDAEWALDHAVIEPGQQVVVVTDGIAEACGPEGRFGEDRVRAQLAGAPNPVQAVQRLEGALQDFAGGGLEDDVAILALAPASAEVRASRGISISSAKPLAGAPGFGGGGYG